MEEKVIEIICKYQKIDKSKVSLESNLIKDIGLSSFDVISLVSNFEETFDIEIPDRAITTVRTVGDIVNLISSF